MNLNTDICFKFGDTLSSYSATLLGHNLNLSNTLAYD